MPNFEWTDADIALATKLAGERYSAQQIADALRGATRNAVIGKLRRLGVNLRGKGSSASEFWTAGMDAKLRKMWLASAPAEAIGQALNLQANTICKRARYLDLPKRATGKAPPPKKTKAAPIWPVPSAPLAIVRREDPAPTAVCTTLAAGVHVLDATAGHCRFPLWPDYARIPLEQKFFCGETAGTSSYCTHHAARCAGIGTASERRAMEQAA